MSRWLFDLGNTRLKAAPLGPDGRPGPVLAIAHDGVDLAAELDRQLPASFDVATVASVAAEPLRVVLLQALAARCRRISLASTTHRWGDLRIAYAEPSRLGVDRFLAMLGARATGTGAVLACGVGTALTIDLVDADSLHRGGRIAPSPGMMRSALHARVSQLPEQGGRYLEFAGDTEDALASGCDGAALALVERSIAQSQVLLGVPVGLLLHGGGAGVLQAMLPEAELIPGLVLEGLAHWALSRQ